MSYPVALAPAVHDIEILPSVFIEVIPTVKLEPVDPPVIDAVLAPELTLIDPLVVVPL
jgi:hypothetical protein